MSNIHERNVMIEPIFSIALKGKTVGEDMLKYVSVVEVEDEEDKLPIARIEINDVDRKWLNDSNVLKGTTISIKMGHKKSMRSMFNGKIIIVDGDFPENGDSTLVVNAVDIAVKLMDEREARSFKKAKVSDVIKIMLKEANLTHTVEDTGAIIGHIPQEKESNLEFITRWRKKLGWFFYKMKGTNRYYFGKSREKGTVKTLGYKTGGLEIISFSPTYQDYETGEEKVSESDIDSKGGVPTYTVRNTKGNLVYSGKKDPSKPSGKA